MSIEFWRINDVKFLLFRVALLMLVTTSGLAQASTKTTSVHFPIQGSRRPLLGYPRAAGKVIEVSLPSPFDTEPFDTETTGNAAANLFGFFRQDGGPQLFRYFIGTNLTPGSLIMDFAVPFTDGPGNDFAILTNSQSWGPFADKALFEFFFGGNLQGSFITSLAPDQLFQFDLPGSGLVVDRVVVTNITPDPPGIDDLATMTFDDAGVAYLVGEPVIVDIKPGSDSNPINPKSNGVISVAILSTSTFEATKIDPLTVKFGPNQATEVHGRSHIEDVNGDRKFDLILHFNMQETGIQCGDTSVFLTGETFGGQPITGFDLIRTLGCK